MRDVIAPIARRAIPWRRCVPAYLRNCVVICYNPLLNGRYISQSRLTGEDDLAFVSLREGEEPEALLKRFQTSMQRSGILRELRNRRFFRSKGEQDAFGQTAEPAPHPTPAATVSHADSLPQLLTLPTPTATPRRLFSRRHQGRRLPLRAP